MEFNDGIDKYKLFESIHKLQLESSGVPNWFWLPLYKKLENKIFDSGSAFSIFQVQYNGERLREDPKYTVLVTKEDGIQYDDPNQVYLIDHAWTYDCNKAFMNLMNIRGLMERMCNLMGLSVEDDFHKNVENICREMWCYNQTYSRGFGEVENRIPVWYVMDEFGSAIEHSDVPNFRIVPFFYVNEQITYSLLFPIANVNAMERVTRNYIEGCPTENEILKRAFMIPWRPFSFLDFSFTQTDSDENYFTFHKIKETLPINQRPTILDKVKILKVYSEYDLVNNFLRHPKFVMVHSPNEADILWVTYHFKNYKEFYEDSPVKFINQFPCESVLTFKNLLGSVSRRKKQKHVDEYFDNPPWCPTTYDLNENLVEFVSYFQHRDKQGLDNLWICKPWNLARGLDIIITDNIKCIVRLPSSGKKLAQKYINTPVLFHREDVGLVKFDIRYIVLLKCVKPLNLYIYKKFFLRFANKAFDLTDFWDREKHFTVMNYDEEAQLYKMLADEFIEKFNQQYPQFEWKAVEDGILQSLRELFEAASEKPPPYGLGHNIQSRAIYAVDVMLSLENSTSGSKIIQPKILEVNWLPDCTRACQYYPTFFDDIFLLLFKDEYDETKFRKI